MFRGLSKLAAALTIIFVISLAALFLELFYILWRRHHHHHHDRHIPTTFQGNNNLHFSQSLSSISKEQLLYFFCLKKNLSQVEPNSAKSADVKINGSSPDASENEVIDVFKLLNMRGPSRVLYTIKEEEEREDVELAYDEDGEREIKVMKCNSSSRRMSLKECFESVQESPLVVTMVMKDENLVYSDDDGTTPFSTPYNSPAYFTPMTSPTGEIAIEPSNV